MLQIIDYSKENKDYFKSLNVEWISKYFYVEPIDELVLSNPESEIINKAGFIYFAEYDNQIVGVVALIKINDSVFEISKMAVTSKYQGKKIGLTLLLNCINKAKQLKLQKLILYSNTKLPPAVTLYRKLGFVEVLPDKEVIYVRSDIKMELNIN